MLLAAKKEHAVQSFMLSVINNSCAELRALDDGPRGESRVNLTVVALVIPLVKKRPVLEKMFPAVTKEFTSLGISLVVRDPQSMDEVIVALRWEDEMRFVRAQAKHLSAMGAGFYQLGLRLKEMIHPSDCPALRAVEI